MKIVHDADVAAASGELAELSRFRSELYGCLTARADALFGWRPLPRCPEIF